MADDDKPSVNETPEFQEALEAALKEARDALEQETAGLKANRDDALKEKKKLAAQMKQYEALGLSPEEVAALKARADEQAAKDAKDSNDWEARETQLKDQHTKVVKDLEARVDLVLAALDKEVRRSKAVAAIAKNAPDSVDLLLPHVLDAVQMVENDGVFTATVRNEDGSPKYMPDPNNKNEMVPMTIEAYVGGMRERFPAAFPGTVSGGSSGGPQHKTNAGGVVKSIDGTADNFNELMLEHAEEIAAGTIRVKVPDLD
ncbi:MAG: hypothetical protein ACYTEX_27860 [Planctomycetota bacterium]